MAPMTPSRRLNSPSGCGNWLVSPRISSSSPALTISRWRTVASARGQSSKGGSISISALQPQALREHRHTPALVSAEALETFVSGVFQQAGVGAEESLAWSRSLAWQRSEEHTSELQSLMRISYAVSCLKKNNTSTDTRNNEHP